MTHARDLTAADLIATLRAVATPDLFGHTPDPATDAARASIRARAARRKRRDAVIAWLDAPWSVWAGDPARSRSAADDPDAGPSAAPSPAAAPQRIARRFLRRFPDRDRPDPAYDLRSDREAAAEYHMEEEALEARRPREDRW